VAVLGTLKPDFSIVIVILPKQYQDY